jgi:hypothetical protein
MNYLLIRYLLISDLVLDFTFYILHFLTFALLYKFCPTCNWVPLSGIKFIKHGALTQPHFTEGVERTYPA